MNYFLEHLHFKNNLRKITNGVVLLPVAEAEVEGIIILSKGISYTLKVKPERT